MLNSRLLAVTLYCLLSLASSLEIHQTHVSHPRHPSIHSTHPFIYPPIHSLPVLVDGVDMAKEIKPAQCSIKLPLTTFRVRGLVEYFEALNYSMGRVVRRWLPRDLNALCGQSDARDALRRLAGNWNDS